MMFVSRIPMLPRGRRRLLALALVSTQSSLNVGIATSLIVAITRLATRPVDILPKVTAEAMARNCHTCANSSLAGGVVMETSVVFLMSNRLILVLPASDVREAMEVDLFGVTQMLLLG